MYIIDQSIAATTSEVTTGKKMIVRIGLIPRSSRETNIASSSESTTWIGTFISAYWNETHIEVQNRSSSNART